MLRIAKGCPFPGSLLYVCHRVHTPSNVGSLRIGELFTLRGNVMAMNQTFIPSLSGLRSGSIRYRLRGNLNLSYHPQGEAFAAEAFGNHNAPLKTFRAGRSRT